MNWFHRSLWLALFLCALSAGAQAACAPSTAPSFAPRLDTYTNDAVMLKGGCIEGPVINNQIYYAPAYRGAVSKQFCTWDATHDVGDCINGAIATARAAGGGIVQIPAGTFGQTVAISQTASPGVIIEGAGGTGAYAICKTRIKWIGDAGGTQVSFSPDGQNLVGTGLKDLCIDSNEGTAATTVYLRGLDHGRFENVSAIDPSSVAWDLDAKDGTNGGFHNTWFVRTNTFLSHANAASAKAVKIGQSATTTGNDVFDTHWLGGLIQYQNGTAFECGAADSISVIDMDIQPVFGGTGKSLHLLGHASNALLACRSNRFITSGGFGRNTTTRPVADTAANPSLKNYIFQNFESGAAAPLINGSATLTYQTNTGDYSSNAGTTLVQGSFGYKAAGSNNAALDIDTQISGATVGKFGASLPLYLLTNGPIVGFNRYWGTAAFRYGKGSSSSYSGMLSYAPASGLFQIFGTTATGTADAAVSGDTQMWGIDRFGHERVSALAAPALTSCGTTPSISGDDRAGQVIMGTGSPTGCVITFANVYTGVPYCVVSWQTNLASMQYTVSTSAITLTQTATSSNVVNYHCNARSGG